jgi:hypothetical protein
MLNRKSYLVPVAAILAGCLTPASAQIHCTPTVVASDARSTGYTELVGDLVFTCTGGTPTPAGQVVTPVTISVFLNTHITSRITAHTGAGAEFSEALLLIDEPNSGQAPGIGPVSIAKPLLNCGNTGAPDNGPPGPGVCELISDGNPKDSYDGTPWVPASHCATVTGLLNPVFGCGRPNAFQGRPNVQGNLVQFEQVPFDPPGPTGHRILRITNLRANVAEIANFDVLATVGFSGGQQFVPASFTNLIVEKTQEALVASSPSSGTLRIEEGFPNAFKYRNIAFALANAMPVAPAPYPYIFPKQLYPVFAAQNVPGLLYRTEDGFTWPDNGANKPPAVNPPLGYDPAVFDTNPNNPLHSAGYGGVFTFIDAAGLSDAGTRIEVELKASAGGSFTIPNVVYLHPATGPGGNTGVLVLTTTDGNGAGPFTPSPDATTTIDGIGRVVYEVLYSDFGTAEYADIPVSFSGTPETIFAVATLAPHFTTAAAGMATPTAANPTPIAIPRFSPGNPKVITIPAGSPIGSNGGK